MNKNVKILLIAIVVIAFVYLVWQYTRLTNYSFEIRRIKFSAFTLKSIKGTLFIDFENKSDFGYTCTGAALDMYINGVKITSLTSDAEIEIAKNTITPISLNFDTQPNKILSISNFGALQNIADKDKVMFGFYGYLTIKSGILKTKVRINMNHPLSYYTEE